MDFHTPTDTQVRACDTLSAEEIETWTSHDLREALLRIQKAHNEALVRIGQLAGNEESFDPQLALETHARHIEKSRRFSYSSPVLYRIQSDPKFYKKLPDDARSKLGLPFAIEAVKTTPAIYPTFVPHELRDSVPLCYVAVTRNPKLYIDVPRSVKEKEWQLAAIAYTAQDGLSNPSGPGGVPQVVLNDENFYKWVLHNLFCVQHFNSRECKLKANLLFTASDTLRLDRECLLKYVGGTNGIDLELMTHELAIDEEIVVKAVTRGTCVHKVSHLAFANIDIVTRLVRLRVAAWRRLQELDSDDVVDEGIVSPMDARVLEALVGAKRVTLRECCAALEIFCSIEDKTDVLDTPNRLANLTAWVQCPNPSFFHLPLQWFCDASVQEEHLLKESLGFDRMPRTFVPLYLALLDKYSGVPQVDGFPNVTDSQLKASLLSLFALNTTDGNPDPTSSPPAFGTQSDRRRVKYHIDVDAFMMTELKDSLLSILRRLFGSTEEFRRRVLASFAELHGSAHAPSGCANQLWLATQRRLPEDDEVFLHLTKKCPLRVSLCWNRPVHPVVDAETKTRWSQLDAEQHARRVREAKQWLETNEEWQFEEGEPVMITLMRSDPAVIIVDDALAEDANCVIFSMESSQEKGSRPIGSVKELYFARINNRLLAESAERIGSASEVRHVLEEVELEIVKHSLMKLYLEDFAAFCASIGGDTAEVMGEILNARADQRAINVTLNSFGTPLNEPQMRARERRRLYPSIGFLYPAGTHKLQEAADEQALGAAINWHPMYREIYAAHVNEGVDDRSIDDAFYEREVRMLELAFEGQMHFGIYYAFVKLKEQEVRNLVWISECIVQQQKDEINKFVPCFSKSAPWRS